MRGPVLAIISIAMLVFAGQPAASARTVMPSDASPGDRTVPVECPAGQVVSGFSGQYGPRPDAPRAVIHQIRLHCAPLLAGGGIGESRPHDAAQGGGGGMPVEQNCPLGSTPGNISVFYNEGKKQALGVKLSCGGTDYINLGTGIGSVLYEQDSYTNNYHCRPGERTTGLVISSGRHVNGIGVICDAVAAPPAAPPPRVLKSTGKARPAPAGPTLASRAAFGGKWRTRTSSNADFDIVLVPQGDGIIAPGGIMREVELRVVGHFVNLQDAHDYDGTLQGTIPPTSRTLFYSYTQKNGAAGSGTFTLSPDGNALTGEGTASDGTKFTWNGTRAP